MRYAIYFTPPHDDPLTRLAARWLGRDAFTGKPAAFAEVPGIGAEELALQTASARRYGFHATLKAPFTLAPGQTEDALVAAVDAFAARERPLRLPAVRVRQIDGFFALTPAARSMELDELAGEVVSHFDRFRAPASEAEIARRNPETLSPVELAHLHRWGYPYVFEAFRFHMTLTGRIFGADAERFAAAIDTTFGPHIGQPLDIASIALFVEPEPGAPFTVRSWHALAPQQERKTA